MLVAIHQPNFLPWLGFFDKIAQADCFILLDSVPLQLTGGNYTNRVKILIQGKPAWITMPIRRGHEARNRIDHAQVADEKNWRRKMVRTIEQSYGKTPYFNVVMPLVTDMLETDSSSLVEINMRGLLAFARELGLSEKKFVRASSLKSVGASTELLANLVEEVGGDAYLAGHGSGGYQDDVFFAKKGIGVRYQSYSAPAYPQFGATEFVPGLSAIDGLMNCGPDAKTLIGRNPG